MRLLPSKQTLKMALFGTLLASLVTIVPVDNTVDVNGEFNTSMEMSVATDLLDSIVEHRQLLLIESPGGSTNSLESIEGMLRGRDVNTYTNKFAASAAADIAFGANGTIYVEPDALLLFHGAYFQGPLGEAVTQRDLERMLEKNPYMPENERLSVEFALNSLKQINDRSINNLIARHPNVSGKTLLHEVFGNLERDKFFTGQQLKDFGFDIELGAPDLTSFQEMPLIMVIYYKLRESTDFFWFLRS